MKHTFLQEQKLLKIMLACAVEFVAKFDFINLFNLILNNSKKRFVHWSFLYLGFLDVTQKSKFLTSIFKYAQTKPLIVSHFW